MHKKVNNPAGERGFTLVTTGICAVTLFGVMGLAIDMGRLYIAKSESQTFADLTALAGAKELDGTAAGITRAKAKVTGSSMKWNFNTTAFASPVVEFSKTPLAGGWVDEGAAGADPVGVQGVRVTATASNIGLFFLPAVIDRWSASVAARAVAAQQLLTSYAPNSAPGTLPFAPLIRTTGPGTGILTADWGFVRPTAAVPGSQLTLRWPTNPKGNSTKTYCGADDNAAMKAAAEQDGVDARGYIQENSSDAIREAIEDDHVDYTVELGMPVDMTSGFKAEQATSLENRAEQDTDSTSTNYWQYSHNIGADGKRVGNGRRIGLVPMIDPYNNWIVTGFAEVFLPMDQSKQPHDSLCAEYIGPAAIAASGQSGGGGSAMNFAIRLIE